MGWTSYHATYYNKHGEIDRKRECDAYWLEGLNRGYFEVIKSSMVGATYYGAIRALKRRTKNNTVEDIPENEQSVFGVVFLTKTDCRSYYNFCYKDMDETMGPYAYDCPAGVLSTLTDTDNENAIEWRNKCRESLFSKKEYRKNRSILTDLPVGSVIKFASQGSYCNGTINPGDTITLQKCYNIKHPFWFDGKYRWPLKLIPMEFEIEKEKEKNYG